MSIDTFDEPAGSRLNPRDITRVVFEHTDRVDHIRQLSAADGRQANTKVLRDAGIDTDGRNVAILIGVAWHQVHIHERRLAGLFETVLRHHRVVPVQHFGITLDGGCERFGCLVISAGQPVAASRADQSRHPSQGDACENVPAHLASP